MTLQTTANYVSCSTNAALYIGRYFCASGPLRKNKRGNIMTLLIGGIVCAFVGFVGFVLWFGDFLVLLKGAVPLLLLAGGSLAAYIGFDDLQDKLNREHERQEEAVNKAQEEAETARVKAEQYREELEKLKETVKIRTENNP